MEDRVLSLETKMASAQGEMKKIKESISKVTSMLQRFLQEKSSVSPTILPTQTTPSLADLRDSLADWLHKKQKPTDQQLSTVKQLLPTLVASNPIQQDNKSFTQPINNTTLPSFHISPPQPLFTIQDLSQRPIPPVSCATKPANDIEVKLLEASLFFIKQTGHGSSYEKVGFFALGPDPQQKPSPKIRPDPTPNLIYSPRDHNCIPRDSFQSRDCGPCAPRAPPPTTLSSIDSQSNLNRPFPSLLLISGTRVRFVYSLEGILRVPVHHRHDGQEHLLLSRTIDMAMVVEAKIVGNRILAISMYIVIVREEQRDDYVLFAAHSIMSSMRLFVAIQTVKWFGSVSIEILCHSGNPDAVSSSMMEKEGAERHHQTLFLATPPLVVLSVCLLGSSTGNYAAVLQDQYVAKAPGYSDVLCLDCLHKRYLANNLPDLVDRKISLLSDGVATIIDDISSKMQILKTAALATIGKKEFDLCNVRPKTEVEDYYISDATIYCPCDNSLPTESMVQCVDPRCLVWTQTECVIIPAQPIKAMPSIPLFFSEVCRVQKADPFWATVAYFVSPMTLVTSSILTDRQDTMLTTQTTFLVTKVQKDFLQDAGYDIHAWSILLNDEVSYRMQWLLHSTLQVNQFFVQPININGTQMLSATGRDDSAVIQSCISEGAYKISLKRNDAPSFCFWVRLVKAPTVKQVLNLTPKVTEHEFFDDALADVCPCISGGMATGNNNSDSALAVIADSVPVNIRCPMSDALALALIEIDGIGAMDVVARLIVDFCAGELTDAGAKHVHDSSMVALSLEDKAVVKGGVMLGTNVSKG